MAGEVLKKRRLVNPGRRRRLTDRQIKYFGTRRQKAALKNRRRHNRAGTGTGSVSKKAFRRGGEGTQSAQYRYKAQSHARRRTEREERGGYVRRNQGFISEAEHAAAHAIRSVERAAEDAIESLTGAGAMNPGRRRNVGEILTVIPANPGRRRKKMAAPAHNRRRVHNRRRNRARHHNRARRRHNRRSTMNPKVVVRYRNRRHNRHHNRARRRNQPAFLTGEVGAVVGVLGGAAVTKMLANLVPSSWTQGNPMVAGMITAGIAVLQGQGIGMLMKNPRMGLWWMTGGLVMAAIELSAQFFPALALPLSVTGGASGMGLLTSSNFYVPQVNVPGSMATFIAPAAIPAPVVVPAGGKMSGLGYSAYPGFRTVRRTGRLR